MSTESPVITKAVVELTFANGVTRRFVLDDKDCPITFDVLAETDVVETTADDASYRTYAAGLRQTVNLQLAGRGPLQLSKPNVTSKVDADRLEQAFNLLCCTVDAGKRGEFACPNWFEAWEKFRDDYHAWLAEYCGAASSLVSAEDGAAND